MCAEIYKHKDWIKLDINIQAVRFATGFLQIVYEWRVNMMNSRLKWIPAWPQEIIDADVGLYTSHDTCIKYDQETHRVVLHRQPREKVFVFEAICSHLDALPLPLPVWSIIWEYIFDDTLSGLALFDLCGGTKPKTKVYFH